MLTVSRDRKTAPVVKSKPLPNAFGLAAGPAGSCPFATELCIADCYADAAETRHKEVSAAMARNLAILQACGDDIAAMAELLAPVVAKSYELQVKAGVAPIFRIHWDGDLFSAAYAKAWAQTVRAFPGMTFWLYTRSFAYVPEVVGLANLTVYLSMDGHNYAAAKACAKSFPEAHLAVMAATFTAAEALHRATGRPRAIRCPENAKRLPLVVTGDVKRGACAACGNCITGRRDVTFSTSRK